MTTKPYFALQGVQKINVIIISAKKWGFKINHYYWSAENYFFYKVEQFGTFGI